MTARELREKQPAELEGLLLELRREQFNLRMQKGSGQTVKPHLFGRVQRDIARAKTVLNEIQTNQQ